MCIRDSVRAVQIVGKEGMAFIQMAGDVGQFMKEHKPEIVQPVMAQRQGNDAAPLIEHGGAIEVGAFEMRFDHQCDTCAREVFAG